MDRSSTIVVCMAIAAGKASPLMAQDAEAVRAWLAKRVRPAPERLTHVEYDLRAGTVRPGSARQDGCVVWDAFSVYTGSYTTHDDPSSCNPFCPVCPDLGTEWINAGDLPDRTRVDKFQFAYYAPGIPNDEGVSIAHGFGAWISFYMQWSERRDHCFGGQETPPPAYLLGGFLLTDLPAGPDTSWVVTVNLLPMSASMVFTGVDEDCDLDSSTNPDWGWGLSWEQNQAVQGIVGPLVTDAGPITGSNAEGASNSWSIYNARPLSGSCVDICGCGTPWADFWMGLWRLDDHDDCDCDGVKDWDEPDCDANGIPDDCERVGMDCDENGIPDRCELAGRDCDGNGVLDVCESGYRDCDRNGIIDECEPGFVDCNGDGIRDGCEGWWADCNDNGIPDSCELEWDCNGNGRPDVCDGWMCRCDLADPRRVLDIFDFVAFQRTFGEGSPCADLAPPWLILDAFDFLAFQTCFGDCRY